MQAIWRAWTSTAAGKDEFFSKKEKALPNGFLYNKTSNPLQR